MKLGNTTIWSKDGLNIGIVKYDTNPNKINIKWASVDINLTDGNTESGKSIETIYNRNFILLLIESNNKIIWVPFQAIESMRLSKTNSKNFKEVSVQEDIYGWFRFEDKSYDIDNIGIKVEISLTLPDNNGANIVQGWLLDSPGTLVLFKEYGSKEIPWTSISRLSIKGNKSSKSEADESDKFTRNFVYRTTEQWSNVWKEYFIPSKE
jgi:hypothetical protein